MGRIVRYKYLFHILIVLFLLTECATVWLVVRNYRENHQSYIEKNTREFDIGLSATLRHFEEVAQSLLLTSDSKNPFTPAAQALDMFVQHSFSSDTTAVSGLDKLFDRLASRGFKGFTIADSNGVALIRLHNPNFKADTLENLLPLMHEASKNQSPAIGFHAGGVATGYCVVMPLRNSYNQLFYLLLGIDNVALQQEMKKIFPYEFVFLINKEQVLRSTPYPMLSGYHFSDLSVDYFYERSDRDVSKPGMRHYIPQSEIVLFNQINKREIESGIDRKLPFGLHAQTGNGTSYTGLFFPVHGPDGQIVAFIISYSSDSTLSDYYNNGLIIMSVSVLLVLFVFFFLLFFVVTFRRLSLQNMRLAESERQLQELNKAKDKFFSIIAHDLRNPFHGLVGLAEVLTEDYDAMPAEKTRRFHQLIYDSSRQGYQLVNNLLEWTRMQTGRFAFNPEKLNVQRFVGEVADQLRSSIEAKGIALVVDVPGPLYLYADHQMVCAIVRNLLSNAIKFSHPGGKIFIRAVPVGQYLRISIADQGVGMDGQTKSDLWKIELSHSSKGTLGETGTGLGLLLVREFVERHKGTISVESEPGLGTTFTVSLPLNKTI